MKLNEYTNDELIELQNDPICKITLKQMDTALNQFFDGEKFDGGDVYRAIIKVFNKLSEKIDQKDLMEFYIFMMSATWMELTKISSTLSTMFSGGQQEENTEPQINGIDFS